MSVAACADLVERADRDRFLTTMAAPVSARQVLFPIYAFNVEISRTPWVTQEPMIAEMRLQWWHDALDEIAAGGPVRSHEITHPLAEVLDAEGANLCIRAVEARRWDIYTEPFEDEAAFSGYLDDTGAGLTWAAARALGAPAGAERVVRDFGWGAALAAWLRAISELEARGRKPLPDGRPAAVEALARDGLERISRSRKARGDVPVKAGPALLAGWQAGSILRQAAADPGAVADGRLGLSEFRARASLLWRGFSGRW